MSKSHNHPAPKSKSKDDHSHDEAIAKLNEIEKELELIKAGIKNLPYDERIKLEADLAAALKKLEEEEK